MIQIPENATRPGSMANASRVDAATSARFQTVLDGWQLVVNHHHYVTMEYTNHPADQVHGYFGEKYARLDIGTSAAFMVDISSGIVYGVKGYGVVNKKKVSGNIFDPAFTGSVLLRDRFRRGPFSNNPDGSAAALKPFPPETQG